MPELGEHGDADLVAKFRLLGKISLQRQAIDRDPVRQVAGVGAALRQRHALEQAIQVGVVGVLRLDDDGNVPQAGGDLRIASPGEQARMLLSLTSLDQVLKVHPTIKEAHVSFA